MAKNKDLDEIIETLGELGFTEETEEREREEFAKYEQEMDGKAQVLGQIYRDGDYPSPFDFEEKGIGNSISLLYVLDHKTKKFLGYEIEGWFKDREESWKLYSKDLSEVLQNIKKLDKIITRDLKK